MPTKKKRTGSSKSSKKTLAEKGDVRPTKKRPVAQSKKAPLRKKQPLTEATRTDRSQLVAGIADPSRVWADLGKLRAPAQFRVSCIRADDLLVCDFIFENFRLELDGPEAPKLVRRNPGTATLIVEFPPQSFGEEAYLDTTGESQSVPTDVSGKNAFPEKSEATDPKNVRGAPADPLRPMPSAKIRMSGRSRIAFKMKDEETELPFTIEAILDACRRWPMRLSVNAIPDAPPFRVGLSEFGVQDKFLASVVASHSWNQARIELTDALGGQLEKALAGAAQRISQKAITAIRSGRRIEASAMLRRAINQELDVLAARSAPLREPGRREMAAAALSMKATELLAGYRLDESVFDLGKELPFLPLIFGPHEPPKNVTALELPYRLILSPVPSAFWHHSPSPIVHNNRTELWHTRLTSTTSDTGPDTPTKVRALWSPDYDIENIIDKVNNNRPFRMTLDPLDRQMLVKLMAGFGDVNTRNRPYNPLTSVARRLSLSSLGALLDAEGGWERPVQLGVGLEQWRHLATLGRDHYVRVVYRGFLQGFGHAASLVKVTERKFEYVKDKHGNNTLDRVAVLRQRFYIIVREPVKHYHGAGHEHQGRNFPFKSVEILTRVTPSLRAPDLSGCPLGSAGNSIYDGTDDGGSPPRPNGIPYRACFWPMLDQFNNFMFQIAATDLSGNRVTFATPLLFVGVEANEHWKPGIMAKIINDHNAEPPPRRFALMGGASVCYAPIDPDAKGDTRFPTNELVFRTAPVSGVFVEEPQFYPEVQDAKIGIAAIRRLLQQPDATAGVTYAKTYKNHGFTGTNQGELFLALQSEFKLEFGNEVKSDAIGGLATPSMAILGLSRIMGPVSAQTPTGSETPEDKLQNIINNDFQPLDFFKDAKILGGIKLTEILQHVSGLGNSSVPKLLSREIDKRMEASFDWITENVQSDSKGLFVPHYEGTTKLSMHGVVSAPLDGSTAPTFNATASLEKFRINLFGFITIWFDALRFTAQTGAKPDVAVDLHPGERMVEFGGPLEFVNELRKIIPSNGFSDPPSLTVTPSGISASYSISIPSLAVGIFALEHLSLGAGFMLPFDNRPAEVRFNFAERQRPFSLTVSLLGGGGFFAIGIGTEGVREIEAALEFGAALSINLGVASGSVEIKAGIYFHWKTQTVELVGYVRLHGELSVLGLISASLTFNLQLGYTKENGRSVVWGEASIEVEIDILFLSFSVSVSCRREFGGSDGDPKFVELIPDQTTWNAYCGAFATEAA
ncbi:MAG: hypothetical protein QOD75_351 [Blastocatellia bacterium]|nr:hypothetical protein [Blastocatellia bacterium]